MDKNIVVPALLFLCVTYAFRLLVNARLRVLLMRAGSPETVSALLAGELQLRQAESLRAGLSMLGLSIALAVVQGFGWPALSAATFSAVLGAVGVAQLIAHYLLNRQR